MNRLACSFLVLAATFAAPAAFADDGRPASPAASSVDTTSRPLAPTAEVAPPAPSDGMSARKIAGISLTATGGLATIGGAFALALIFPQHAICEDGPCPQDVTNGDRVAMVAGETLAVGALVTGIVLLATGPKKTDAAASRPAPVKVTAKGIGFSF